MHINMDRNLNFAAHECSSGGLLSQSCEGLFEIRDEEEVEEGMRNSPRPPG